MTVSAVIDEQSALCQLDDVISGAHPLFKLDGRLQTAVRAGGVGPHKAEGVLIVNGEDLRRCQYREWHILITAACLHRGGNAGRCGKTGDARQELGGEVGGQINKGGGGIEDRRFDIRKEDTGVCPRIIHGAAVAVVLTDRHAQARSRTGVDRDVRNVHTCLTVEL